MIDRHTVSGLALALPLIALSFSLFQGVEAVLSCLLGCAMLAIALSDARHYIVPDWLSLPAIPIGLVATGLTATGADADMSVLHHTTAALVAGLAFYALSSGFRMIRGYDGLGLGDVKLAAAAGAWTGPEGVILVVLLAALGALAYALLMAIGGRQSVERQTMIPLGAFLAPAIWLVWTISHVG